MFYIDTYDVATVGQNSIDTATRASNGILVSISIETIPERAGGYLGGVPATREDEKRKDKKKIVVNVTIDGKTYKKTKIVVDKPNITVDDVKVLVKEGKTRPLIEIVIL